ncbi:hypothetical protein NADE_008538 [Nannochloris sp. 'desiccata']|nr:hypothetical protein NADE_008538 [Chlorella desiccata (nom. nud.)]
MLAVTNIPRSHVLIKPTQASLRSSVPSTFAARPTKTYNLLIASSSAASAPVPEEEPSTSAAASAPSTDNSSSGVQKLAAWWREKQAKSAELRKRLVSLGPAAVLAYGLFDGISYTIAFSIAFFTYEAQTGLNPTQNVADIIKIVILMWAGNNVTRPFRLAGAAALAPFMDKLMDRLKKKLNLPNKAVAFAIITTAVAGVCFSILGGLFLSRWGVA